MADEPISARDLKALWRMVYQISDDVKASREDGQATRRHLEGWTDPNGTFQPGLLTRHQLLRQDVDDLKAERSQGADRRWLLISGTIGAAMAKAFDWAFTYISSKGGNHP